MKGLSAGLAGVLVVLAGCSPSKDQVDSGLPILENYPNSVNATAMLGSLELQADGCLVFTSVSGVPMLPIFRAGSTIASLQNRFGDLSIPRQVAVMGMTVLQRVPPEVARFAVKHQCEQRPFVFGNFGDPASLPPSPPVPGANVAT